MTSVDDGGRRQLSVVLVGQRPPPYGGQTAMVALTLDAHYRAARLHHVPTAFSRSLEEMRSLQLRKVWHVLTTIARIAVARVRHRGDVLYFIPSPPARLPVVRDVAILLATRWMFRRTIFHFHAGGISTMLDRRRGVAGALLWWAYRHPDVAIRLSAGTPPDGRSVAARREVVIPNAIPPTAAVDAAQPAVPVVLYVGLLSEEKGLFRLLEVARALRDTGLRFSLHLVGEFDSAQARAEANAVIAGASLGDTVVLRGVLVGADKAAEYDGATAFCFLSTFPAETFPLVVLEAMQAGLPVVAARWSGVPDMVVEGENAFLVDPADTATAAHQLGALLTDRLLQRRMGAVSRRIFEERFSVERYVAALDAVFADLAQR